VLPRHRKGDPFGHAMTELSKTFSGSRRSWRLSQGSHTHNGPSFVIARESASSATARRVRNMDLSRRPISYVDSPGSLVGVSLESTASMCDRIWSSRGIVGRWLAVVLLAYGYAAALILAVLLSVVILVASVVGAAALYLAGLGHCMTSPIVEVTAESTPPGSWTVHLFGAREWPMRRRGRPPSTEGSVP
jgi:hypothetical protein